MGEYADMFLDGLLDAETGEIIDGYAPGYPRTKRRQRKGKSCLVKCPQCEKRLRTQQGVDDHIRAKHGEAIIDAAGGVNK